MLSKRFTQVIACEQLWSIRTTFAMTMPAKYKNEVDEVPCQQNFCSADHVMQCAKCVENTYRKSLHFFTLLLLALLLVSGTTSTIIDSIY